MNERHDTDAAARLRGALDRLTADVAQEPPGLDTAVAGPLSDDASRSPRRWVPLAAAASVLVVGVGAVAWVNGIGGETPAADSPTVPASDVPATAPTNDLGSVVSLDPSDSVPSGPVELVATVLESPDHGPQLCSAVADSYPPQCGGPDITNWDWASVEYEASNGTRWGEYLVVGSYDLDESTFTLAGPAVAPDDVEAAASVEPDFSTPCPAPAGGWPEMSMREFSSTDFGPLERIDGFAGLWVDEPHRVVNVRVVGDQDAARAEIAELYAGAVCVTGARYTMAELLDIQVRLPFDGNAVSASVDVTRNRVVLQIQLPDPDLEARLAEQYGDRVLVFAGSTPAEALPAVATSPPSTAG